VSAKTKKWVTVGRLSGAFGVKGWFKVQSYTEPVASLLGFDAWTLRRQGREREFALEDGSARPADVVAKLRGIDDRDAALEWVGAEVAVPRERLPPAAPGEVYWTDLEGCEVRTTAGSTLGTVDHLVATGAHDVLVVVGERERLIPFVTDAVVKGVDLAARVIVVDWPADF
jgi:16S rRNA processing protein RimM